MTTRITVTSDDRRELDRVRAVLSTGYIIRREKAPAKEGERRHRLYLFITPKGDTTHEKALKTS